jgi:hypothetical protein
MLNVLARPIRSTIVWGLIGGLIYIPLCTGFSFLVRWPVSLQLTLWSLLAGYGVFLTRWSSARLRSMGVPFLLLFIAAIFIQSTPVFLFSAFAVLSWIRSGICFRKKPFVKRLGAEIGLGSAAALLVVGAVPGVSPAWALGVLMFFLIQALYFVLLEQEVDPELKIEVDPFEKARMAAENILDSAEKEIII